MKMILNMERVGWSYALSYKVTMTDAVKGQLNTGRRQHVPATIADCADRHYSQQGVSL